jgi:hypothetical protein
MPFEFLIPIAVEREPRYPIASPGQYRGKPIGYRPNFPSEASSHEAVKFRETRVLSVGEVIGAFPSNQ